MSCGGCSRRLSCQSWESVRSPLRLSWEVQLTFSAVKIYGDLSRFLFGVQQSWGELRDYLRRERYPSSRVVRILDLVEFLDGTGEDKKAIGERFFERYRNEDWRRYFDGDDGGFLERVRRGEERRGRT